MHSHTNLRVLFITMSVNKVFTSIVESHVNVIGVIESKSKNPARQKTNLKEFCEEHNLPYYFMNKGCNAELENWVKSLEPDLIVVNGMSELLKKNIIDIPKKGCINLHPTLLPKYRGPYPYFWIFYDMDLNQGSTVHYIDEGEDTGDIIYQESCRIPFGCTQEELIEELESKTGVKLLLKAINAIENGYAPRIKQPENSPTVRARQITPDEFKSIVDWENWDIERIWHLLRGTQNWLNAYDFSDIPGTIIKWRVNDYVKEPITSNIKFGKVYQEDNYYFVYCRQGKIFMDVLYE